MQAHNRYHASLVTEKLKTFRPSSELDDEKFDALAKYILVASEMENEPFFSLDYREGIGAVGSSGSKRKITFLGHPAFLKSAILPFRKFWMRKEPCCFETICNLISKLYGSMILKENLNLAGFLSQVIDYYKSSLNNRLPDEISTTKVKTVRDLINLWIYTHGVHAGKSTTKKGKPKNIWDFELEDFDEVIQKSGRFVLECHFRTHLRLIAYNSYIRFYDIVALPVYEYLLAEGRCPSFEVEAAFRFNPYQYDGKDVILRDPFWHLDKETEEETFDRLIERNSYRSLDSFFAGYFFSRRKALSALKAYDTLDSLLKHTSSIEVTSNDKTLRLMSSFSTKSADGSLAGRIIVYENQTIYFEDNSREALCRNYLNFREEFYDHRQQVPYRYDRWKYDDAWS